MEALKINVLKMIGMIMCLFAQGKINKGLFTAMIEQTHAIDRAAQVYAKPKTEASFSEVEEYVNKHINMADTAILEAELQRRQEFIDNVTGKNDGKESTSVGGF